MGSAGTFVQDGRNQMRDGCGTTLGLEIKVWLLVAAGIAHFAYTFYAAAPGYISIDEGIYHWMAKTFYDTGGLELWNGFDEFPSPNLVYPLITAQGGRLFPIWPYLFPVLAFPFYHFFGYLGLFVLNAFCFSGVVALSYSTARTLFHDANLALNSCLIVVFATFMWDYSQAGLPQMAAALFVTGAFYLAVCAYQHHTPRRTALLACASGLVAGFGVGIRVDAGLIVPALVLPFLFARPWRPGAALMVLVGLVPGLSVLSWTNLIKFGTWAPLSYGAASLEPIPPKELLVFAGVTLVLIWVASRRICADFLARHRLKAVVFGVAVMALVCVLAPRVIMLTENIVDLGYAQLVDIGSLDPYTSMAPSVRTASGAVLTGGAYRRALVQSLPFLAVLALPAVVMARGGPEAGPLAMLFLAPLSFVLYYAFALLDLSWGGLVINSRYHLPCLPFFSILTAYALRTLQGSIGKVPMILAMACSLTAVAAFVLLTAVVPDKLSDLEFPLLVVPLFIAGCLAVVTVACGLQDSPGKGIAQKVCVGVLFAAFGYSGAQAFLYDHPVHQRWRTAHAVYEDRILSTIPENSLLLTAADTYVPSVKLIEKVGVRRALVQSDDPDPVRKLLDYHLRAGRRVFAFLQNVSWDGFRKDYLKGYTTSPIWTDSRFVIEEIAKPEIKSEEAEIDRRNQGR